MRDKTVHSLCLPYYDGGEHYVSCFDLEGKEHRVNPDTFRDITTEAGRLLQFYAFEVECDGKRRD
jgi:hypothetical protein